MTWVELEPTWEYPYYTYYTSEPRLISGRHYYGYFTREDGHYRGWIMSVPGHTLESYIDVSTTEEAKQQFKDFLELLGG